MGIKQKLRDFWAIVSIGDPNSPKGLRYRARRLVRHGVSPDNPMVTVLLKQADMKEGKELKTDQEYWAEAEGRR